MKYTTKHYIEYHRCPKSFYLMIQEDKNKIFQTLYRQRKIKVGDEVEKLAKQRYQGGTKVDRNIEIAIQETKQLIAKKTPIIFNGAFQYNNFYTICDVLILKDNIYELVEIKSAISRDIFNLLKKGSKSASANRMMRELAFQKYILNKNHIESKGKLLLINQLYVRQGNLNLEKLFDEMEVEEKVASYLVEVEETLEKMELLAKKEEPAALVGGHCKNPIPCDYNSHCWKDIGMNSIHKISRISDKKRLACQQLQKNTVEELDLEKDGIDWTQDQKNAILKIQKGRIIKNQMMLNMKYLNRLKYPLYHLDFETYQPTIPKYKKTSPYQDIPFQYSLHIEKKNGQLEHKEFLHTEDSDPRLHFIEALIKDLENSNGNVVVYNKVFEAGILDALGEAFPDYQQQLLAIRERIFDLMIPFKDGLYYHPKMFFSYSLKAVLPALVPQLSYKNLAIQDGLQGMGQYFQLLKEKNEDKRNKIKKNLLDYCKLDTLAMVEIIKVLKNR